MLSSLCSALLAVAVMSIFLTPLRARIMPSQLKSIKDARKAFSTQAPSSNIASPKSDIQPSDSRAQTMILPDGRTLGYAEYGAPTGSTLLYFHGFPTSRLEVAGLDSMLSRLQIRVLALDRPGFGISTFAPNRRIMDWVADVEAFATGVGISKFKVLGASGGGPYALACARILPKEKMTGVGVLAGAGIWDRGWRTEMVPWYSRLFYLMVNHWPTGTRILSAGLVGMVRWLVGTKFVERKIDGLLDVLFEKAAAEKKRRKEAAETERIDGEARPGKTLSTTAADSNDMDDEQEPKPSTAQRRKDLLDPFFDAYTQGTQGLVHEARLLTRDWGIRFEEITYDKVQIWHGSKDVNAPVRTIRDISRSMPHCVLKEYDDDHFTMGYHVEEVLRDLMFPSEDIKDDA